MKRFILLIGIVGLFVAGNATGDWLKNCVGADNAMCTAENVPFPCCTGAAAGACNAVGTVGILARNLGGTGKTACHRFSATADDDPSILQVTDCDNVDIFYYPDFDGDGADSAGTVDIYTCPSTGNAILNTEAELLLACQPLDGGTQLDAANTEAMGVGAGYLWFNVEGWTDDNELQVVCNVGPQ